MQFNDACKRLILILAIVGFGLFAVNQTLEYRYRAVFLQQPCQVCKQLNPNQTGCIDDCFKIKNSLFQDEYGNWKTITGKCYDLAGKEQQCLNTTFMFKNY